MSQESPIVPLDWITEDDFVILSWLAEREIVTTPKVLAWEIDMGYGRIRNRLSVLRDHNLVEHPEEDPDKDDLSNRGVYQITELGKQVAGGELTINEMRELEKEGAFEAGG